MFAENTLKIQDNGKIDMTEGIEYASGVIRSYLSCMKLDLKLAIIYIMDDRGFYEKAVREMKTYIESQGVKVDCFNYDDTTIPKIIADKIVECNKEYTGIYIVGAESSAYDLRYFRNLIDKEKCIDGYHDQNIADIMRHKSGSYSDYMYPVDVLIIQEILKCLDKMKEINFSRTAKILLIDEFEISSLSMKILSMDLLYAGKSYLYYNYSYNNTSLWDLVKDADIIIAGHNRPKSLNFDNVYDSDYIEYRKRVIIDLGATKIGSNVHGNVDIESFNENYQDIMDFGYDYIRYVESKDIYNIHLMADALINNMIKGYYMMENKN